jgi:hypothetical protein
MLAIVVVVMLLLAMTGRSLSYHAGGVEAYFSNRDASLPATFDILRFVVYEPLL